MRTRSWCKRTITSRSASPETSSSWTVGIVNLSPARSRGQVLDDCSRQCTRPGVRSQERRNLRRYLIDILRPVISTDARLLPYPRHPERNELASEVEGSRFA